MTETFGGFMLVFVIVIGSIALICAVCGAVIWLIANFFALIIYILPTAKRKKT